MIKIIKITQSEDWDNIVKSFQNYDVYYLSGYVKAFQIHGDGEPILIHIEHQELRGICVYIKRDVPFEPKLDPSIDQKYYDLITPYGYGGFVFEGNIDQSVINAQLVDLKNLFKAQNIICEFVRWHPMLNNADVLHNSLEIINLGTTIHIDTSSEEIIWANITSKNRNTIRSAKKKGVTIKHSKDKSLFIDFQKIYNSTMDKDNADSYYYFEDSFYNSIVEDLHDNYEMFYAEHNGTIIAMSIMIYANMKMHYHLSGSLLEYRNYNPSNLLLYEAACWGAKQGFKTFHLGGGLGSVEDNLFKFKQAFNRNSSNQFSISKIIHNEEIYNNLVHLKKEKNLHFNVKSSFFPLYRS